MSETDLFRSFYEYVTGEDLNEDMTAVFNSALEEARREDII